MMSSNQVFSLLDDDDEDTLDVKVLMPTTSCQPCSSPGSYSGATTPRYVQGLIDDPTKMERDNMFGLDLASFNYNTNSSNSNTPTGTPSTGAVKQRESSEYNYAQALLKQAPKLTSSGDLDRSSVLRLAQAYITLQQGLQSWESAGNQARWWPSNIDGGSLALAAQETMSCFVLIMTSQGNVVYVSDAVEMLLGHDQLTLVGRSIQNLVHPEELPVFAAQFSPLPGPGGRPVSQRSFYTRMLSARRSGPQHQQFELVHVVGHLQKVSLAPGSQSSGGQKETWLMCACRVMAPQVEEEGSNSTCTEWVTHNALDGKIIYMDARSSQVSGYLPNEMVGLSPYCFIHQDDQEHVAFSHNQALINVGGSSCTYRMYTRSQDLVYVNTTKQLARDKHTNKPKFLFMMHRLIDEREGKDQVSRHQQELMWVKTDPSIKYSMTDIERTVKALEVEGGNSPAVVSKGGMKNSLLTDSCAADGGDLLSINLSHCMRIPPLAVKTEMGQWSARSSCQQQQGTNSAQFSSGSYQQTQDLNPLSSPLPGSAAGYGGNYAFVNSPGQQHMYNRQTSQPQQQQQQQHIYGSHRPQYQQQMSVPNTGSMCHGMPGNGDASSPASTGSFVDYLFDNAGPPSVPSDNSAMFNADTMATPSMLTPSVRARGRGRARGRPRGSGRGSRGASRGTRGSRGRGSRSRGRGSNIAQLSQLREAMGNIRKSDSNMGQSMSPISGARGSMSPISVRGSLSPRGNMSPMGNAVDHVFASPNTGVGPQRSASIGGPGGHQQMPGGRNIDLHRMASEGGIGSHQMQSDGMSSVQQSNSVDNMLFQRMTSLDGMDVLDTSSDFGFPRSLEIPPKVWGSPDRTLSGPLPHYKSVPGTEQVQSKRGRGGRAQRERQQQFQRTQSVDEPQPPSLPVYGAGARQSMLYGSQGSPYHGQGSYTGGGNMGSAPYRDRSPHSTGGGGSNNNSSFSSQNQGGGTNGNNFRSQDGFQRSKSLQGQTAGRMTPETDPEHSILGNLLKGRGGSTSSTGIKSPAQSTLNDRAGRSPAHSIGPERGSKSPASQSVALDRGGRSPAHSLISDAASPVSVFSPDPSSTPFAIKDEPELMSPLAETSTSNPSLTNVFKSSSQPDQLIPGDQINPMLEQGEQKTLSEMQMFSTQLRQKHRTLEQSLVSQDSLLRQLESNMKQAVKDSNPESIYARLNARLDSIKADKAKQEKELRAIQANLEAQVHLQQQQQLHQQQHLDLQRHRLNSPAPTNNRRMAIVPPLQRQPTVGDLNLNPSQQNSGDMKSTQDGGGLKQNSSALKSAGAPSPHGNIDGSAKANSAVQKSGQKQKQSPGGAASTTQNHSQHNFNPQPQPSPYSLHHHHHHHHHYHHHPIPQQPASRLSQQHLEFNSPAKGRPPPPPPAYSSYEGSPFAPTSTVAIATQGAITPGALSISVSNANTSLASPIICDTSPVSVDESPSCSSDTSSGYHSMSHGADTMSGTSVSQYSKAPCHDMAQMTPLPAYNSKTPPAYRRALQGRGKSPDLIPTTVQMSSNSPPS